MSNSNDLIPLSEARPNFLSKKDPEPVSKCNEPFGISSGAFGLVDDCDDIKPSERDPLRAKAWERAEQLAKYECSLHKDCKVTYLIPSSVKFSEKCSNRELVVSLDLEAVCKKK